MAFRSLQYVTDGLMTKLDDIKYKIPFEVHVFTAHPIMLALGRTGSGNSAHACLNY